MLRDDSPIAASSFTNARDNPIRVASSVNASADLLRYRTRRSGKFQHEQMMRFLVKPASCVANAGDKVPRQQEKVARRIISRAR